MNINLIKILGLCFILYLPSNASAITLQQYIDEPKGRILLMRHELAPGFGDPANFKLGDCSTQRNSGEEGRDNSVKAGRLIKTSGLAIAGIYSSQWCRCLETAELLGIGKIIAHPGLNSFFQDFIPKDKTIAELNKLIVKLKEQKGIYLLVTHQVIITHLTGRTVASGAMVAFDPVTGDSTSVELSPN